MHELQRTANLLGAAALALTDLTLSDAVQAAGVSASAAAALVTLSASPGVSVTELGRRVGLTQSAAARMVDSLEAGGLVERRPNPFSSKWVTLYPTRAGRRAAHRLLGARGGPLADAVAALDEADQQALAGLLPKLLTRIYEQVGDAQYICRLCDRPCCNADPGCPVGRPNGRTGAGTGRSTGRARAGQYGLAGRGPVRDGGTAHDGRLAAQPRLPEQVGCGPVGSFGDPGGDAVSSRPGCTVPWCVST